MKVTDIYEAMNSKAEAFFEWLQAHPKYGLLFGVGLLALWLAGLLFRWKWACHWPVSYTHLVLAPFYGGSFNVLSASGPKVFAQGT